jgi:hypothetical protein
MTRHERIVLDFRGGPNDGSRKDLGESTDGTWPTEYLVHRWPANEREMTSSGPLMGRYVRTDEWDPKVEARVYVWRPEAGPEGT